MSNYLNDFILNLLNTSINGIFVLLLVLLICLMKSRLSAQTRSRILLLAFAVLFVVFLSTPLIRSVDFSGEKKAYSVIDMNEYKQAGFISQSDRLLQKEADQKSESDAALVQELPVGELTTGFLKNWQKGFFILWLPGFLWCVMQMGIGFLGTCKIKRNAREESFPEFEKVKELLGCRKSVRVLVNSFQFSPFTFGFLRPVIVLPGEALFWTKERLEITFMHEMVHVVNADFLKNIFIRIVCAIFWFNPFIWKTLNQYHFEQEAACDMQVLSNGIEPYTYAKELLALAKSCKPAYFVNSFVGSKKSNTEKRILEILSESKPFSFSPKNYLLFTVAIMLSLLASVFTFTFVRADNLVSESAIPRVWPMSAQEYYVSSEFGDKILTETGVNKDVNRGINISWSGGVLEAYASADGVVEQITEDVFGKTFILISHPNGMSTYYKNLYCSLVKKGEKVKQGDVIGFAVGNPKNDVLKEATGNVDFHFEIRKGRKVIDPLLLLELPDGNVSVKED